MMCRKERFGRFWSIVARGVTGGVAARKFSGWIDRLVHMQTIGLVIGAGAASPGVFNIV
jgi:hypothetical protein